MDFILQAIDSFSGQKSNSLESVTSLIDKVSDTFSADSFTNSEMFNEMVEEARYLVYFYNTTTLVTTGGLLLGIVFIFLALALYFYYYVSDGNSGRSDGGSGRNWFTEDGN